MIWRDDFKSKVRPTSGTIVPCAEDLVKTEGPYTLVIVHAMANFGAAFMPSVRGSGVANGKLEYVKDNAQAYQAALTQGQDLLKNRMEELEREYALLRRT